MYVSNGTWWNQSLALAIPLFRRVKSTPDPNAFEKYRDTPPISSSIIYTANLYHNTAPICIAILFAEVLGSGVIGALPPKKPRNTPETMTSHDVLSVWNKHAWHHMVARDLVYKLPPPLLCLCIQPFFLWKKTDKSTTNRVPTLPHTLNILGKAGKKHEENKEFPEKTKKKGIPKNKEKKDRVDEICPQRSGENCESTGRRKRSEEVERARQYPVTS